jgi:hypothetical protein
LAYLTTNKFWRTIEKAAPIHWALAGWLHGQQA